MGKEKHPDFFGVLHSCSVCHAFSGQTTSGVEGWGICPNTFMGLSSLAVSSPSCRASLSHKLRLSLPDFWGEVSFLPWLHGVVQVDDERLGAVRASTLDFHFSSLLKVCAGLGFLGLLFVAIVECLSERLGTSIN